MSSQSNGNSEIPQSVTSPVTNVGSSNMGNFSTGLGSVDPNTGLNGLNGSLMGPNAGTLPNGFATANGASSNYVPTGSGISQGALNGNLSFSMPSSSTSQLNSQALSNALATGAKISGSTGSTGTGTQRLPTGNAHVTTKPTQFQSPITDFAGSNGGSQAGSALLQLLAKYHPGAQ